ncbi:MAG: hypothetical protein ACR2QH_15145 [Geminicoccaceae bacterium]
MNDDTYDSGDVIATQIAIEKLKKEVRAAAKTMTEREARILVDSFETLQRERVRNNNRVTQLQKDDEPVQSLSHFFHLQQMLEIEMGAVLAIFANNHPLTQWMMKQKGIGPLISVRLLAFVDWERQTPSQIWAFAGFNPNKTWEKGEKRPWNARLKRLCYLIGESFVKNQGRDDAFYPDLFAERKKLEWTANMSGNNKAAALAKAEAVGKSTEAYKWYSGCVAAETARMILDKTWPKEKKPWEGNKPGDGLPMLPPAHIHARARRWVVKLFLSHIWWKYQESKPNGPGDLTPYAPKYLTDEGHSHIIEPPD